MLERTNNYQMLFGHYNNLDDSMRFPNGELNSGPDNNDWHKDQKPDVFINGQFNRTGYSVYQTRLWALCHDVTEKIVQILEYLAEFN